MFYDIYVNLCNQKGISPSKAAESVGLSRTSVVKWKAGTIPSGATLNVLAQFFNVSVDRLLGNGQKEKPAQKVQVKPRLRSVARLEETPITPEQDKEIADYIEYILKKRDKS